MKSAGLVRPVYACGAMTSPYDTYTSPLASRNASAQMLGIWSPRHKFNTWRQIWLAVASSQHEMGLPVSAEQVAELRRVVQRSGGIADAELAAAEGYERQLRHDVMAHVHALGDVCPLAKGIIHLGMTSQDVVCNADLLILRQASALVMVKCARTIDALLRTGKRYLGLPTLGFTHYQPAQPVTVGRRMYGWAYELSLVQNRLRQQDEQFQLKGFRGATGTQASYLALFGGDGAKVDAFEARAVALCLGEEIPSAELATAASLAELAGVSGEAAEIVGVMMRAQATPAGYLASCTHALVTQNYPRVCDAFILADLAACASVLHKVATDIRLLCNRKEVDEPFEDKQIGSSAMPYKRNPMRCERICGLCRFVMNLVGNAYDTAATQWLERTLDDSSNRRLSLPEAFLALDGALDLMHNVASGLVVHEATVRANLMDELPFMVTENILMACVGLGADRQEYHEVIRVHAQAAGLRVKQEGRENDLLERLKADPHFHSAARGGKLASELDWSGVLDPMAYIGRSIEQAERFAAAMAAPDELLAKYFPDGVAESAPRV